MTSSVSLLISLRISAAATASFPVSAVASERAALTLTFRLSSSLIFSNATLRPCSDATVSARADLSFVPSSSTSSACSRSILIAAADSRAISALASPS